MPSYPNRCQHLKVNRTQCGSPAIRRNRFCYFHKRHHEERVALHLDQLKNDRLKDERRRRRVMIDLPVLEDANSIQVSLMQIMRLIIAGQIDGKAAGLLLYALQTASSNLPRTKFEPYIHDVVLDPHSVGDTPLEAQDWEDDDFDEEEEDEESESEEEAEAQAKLPAKRPAARLGDNCVITADGEEILKGFPLQTQERTVNELIGPADKDKNGYNISKLHPDARGADEYTSPHKKQNPHPKIATCAILEWGTQLTTVIRLMRLSVADRPERKLRIRKTRSLSA
jgi:hypothetical protein